MPLFFLFLSLAFGVSSGISMHFTLWSTTALFFLFVAFLFITRKNRLVVFISVFWLFGILLGYSTFPVLENSQVEYVGIVEKVEWERSVVASSGYMLEEGSWKKLRIPVKIKLPKLRNYQKAPEDRQVIWVAGELRKVNRYPFYEITAEIFGVAPSFGPVDRLAGNTREYFERRLTGAGINSAIPFALFLGNKSKLSYGLRKAINDLGLSHIFAVSGMHVGIFYLITEMLLAVFLLPKRFRLLTVVLLLLLYILSTGPSISATRAFLVFALYSFFACLDYPQHPLNILGFAGILMLVHSPIIIASVAFQLSFVATAGILILLPILMAGNSGLFKGMVSVSIAAQIAVFPLTVVTFEAVPLLTIPLTIVMVPFFVFPIFVGLILTIVFSSLKIIPLAIITAKGVNFLSLFFEKGLHKISELGLIVTVPFPWSYFVALLVSYSLFAILFWHSEQSP
ncbi:MULTISPECIES: ComEC/Rec2 family competence protein [Kosmotoga]|uniref:ComEC/Rec2-related protein n=1 Tax=Kosmotoga olearia (strain ATCC BAA-1733 / DSM 21960 / TBF 19.5.1) TaxID=521045 RepID=C5CEN7_KOSOT|nr:MULTISPECIES: ComEC/Rec2 family competence protein [Kosmotoga]ACR80217.1 ComEC/Rec2-related protein [Kosmotoga olearia TBF 19.5.1]MDI3523499.1 competence protein ComEC [Kosmotoga sp.]OAA20157.1 hypothetical protein DU53_08410 [Kosmotoga sp. DU53]